MDDKPQDSQDTQDNEEEQEEELNNCNPCTTRPCWKFILASTVSVATTATGIILIFSNPSGPVLSVASSLLGANLTYWLHPVTVNDD